MLCSSLFNFFLIIFYKYFTLKNIIIIDIFFIRESYTLEKLKDGFNTEIGKLKKEKVSSVKLIFCLLNLLK